jgi:hypothetical protein
LCRLLRHLRRLLLPHLLRHLLRIHPTQQGSPLTPLSSSPSSLGSPPVARSHPTFPFHYTHLPRVLAESSDAPSTSGAQSNPTYYLRTRPCPSLDFFNPASYNVSAVPELTTYREVGVHPEWQLGMVEEISTLERTGTWELVHLPPHVCPITCKWVYKVKTCSDGTLECYKARLVARGFQ